MSHSGNEVVQVNFSHTEKEYLAAIKLYLWSSKELLLRIGILYALLSVALVLLFVLLKSSLPLWLMFTLLFLGGLGLFHAFMIDLPRRYFRGDPKFRDEYNLIFSDAGIEFKTQKMKSSLAWSFYTGVIEDDNFYLLVYGKNIHALSILPKRAFRDNNQEAMFRKILRRNLDHTLKLSDSERQNEYVPASLQPPDWR